MAWTTPRTWNVGELVTAAFLNTNIRDNTNALLHPIVLSGTTITIANSTAETSLGKVTVPANSMGANGLLDITYAGEYLATRAVGDTVRLRVNWGGTDIMGINPSDTITLTAGNLTHGLTAWVLNVRVINLGITSSQYAVAEFKYDTFGGSGGQTTLNTWLPTTAQISHAKPTIDTTASRDFEVFATLNAASANLTFTRYLLHGLEASP